jgi:hypothetical protein
LAFGISKSWPVAILAEVVTLCVAGSLYFIGGQDTDIGAVNPRAPVRPASPSEPSIR